ncbi:9563_t:CDS:1 [Dentiscutata erythropus]|uniref:9563_t:CDS:1 n=1 Tax=Dentiscutata erythropus TaxID=1348616 RepID=A0A9N9NMG7_9GLOM|nr:9563_t:CDS:1 [Dentiscutata erythropus]
MDSLTSEFTEVIKRYFTTKVIPEILMRTARRMYRKYINTPGEIVQNEVSNNSNQQQNSLINYDLEACNKNSQLGKRVRHTEGCCFFSKACSKRNSCSKIRRIEASSFTESRFKRMDQFKRYLVESRINYLPQDNLIEDYPNETLPNFRRTSSCPF